MAEVLPTEKKKKYSPLCLSLSSSDSEDENEPKLQELTEKLNQKLEDLIAVEKQRAADSSSSDDFVQLATMTNDFCKSFNRRQPVSIVV